MLNSQVFRISAIFLAINSGIAVGQFLSIDQASPEYPGIFSSADILWSGQGGLALVVIAPAADLGLLGGDELDAFSYGSDWFFPAGSQNWVNLVYSVTRGTVGAGASVIAGEAAGNGAAGDKFVVRIDGTGATQGAPALWLDAVPCGLTPLPPPQSDIDGLSYPNPTRFGVYFSVNAATAARLTGAGLACGPADILYQGNPAPGAPLPVIWATPIQLGLLAGDDIDALGLMDFSDPCTLGGGETVFVSLAPGSPTLLGADGQPGVAGVNDDGINGVDDMLEYLWAGSDDISAAAVIQLLPGPPVVIYPPVALGLLDTDDLNAMTPFDPGKAYEPGPTSGAVEVTRRPALSWSPGYWVADVNGHDVYFGTSWGEVNDAKTSSVTYQGNTVSTWVDPCDANHVRYTYQVAGPLDLVTTYYWRIDEVNEAYVGGPNEPPGPPDGRWKGPVWSFEVEGRAKNPYPPHRAVDVSPLAELSWTAGVDANSHDVYFGTNWDEVNDATTSSAGIYQTTTSGGNTGYEPWYYDFAPEFKQTYYWRIDEVNAATIKGHVWSFTTADYIVVDDFDSYANNAELWAVWDDYWVNGSDAEIFLETDSNFTRDGNSMRYEYTNSTFTGGKYIGAQVDADPIDLECGRDWTITGAKALVLYFLGDPCTVISDVGAVRPWLELEDTSANTGWVMYPDPNHVNEPSWHEWNIDLSIFDACGVTLSNIERLTIGIGGSRVGQKSKASTTNRLWIDDIRLYPPRCVPQYGPAGDLTGDCVANIVDLKIMTRQWVTAGPEADIFADNIVNFKDYCLLADNWLAEQLWP